MCYSFRSSIAFSIAMLTVFYVKKMANENR